MSLAVEQGHAEVTLDSLILEISIEGKLLVDAKRVMTKASADHILARCSDEVVLDVWEDLAVAPVGKGSNARRDAGEFGDERMIHPDRGCEMSHEGLEEVRPRAARGSLDNRPQRDNLVVNRCRSPRVLVRHSQHPVNCPACAGFPVLSALARSWEGESPDEPSASAVSGSLGVSESRKAVS